MLTAPTATRRDVVPTAAAPSRTPVRATLSQTTTSRLVRSGMREPAD